MQQRLKNISFLFSGNLVALLIPYLSSPFLTRIYTSGDFGEFARFMAWAYVLSIFASGGFEYSIILPKNNTTAKQLFGAGFLLSTITFLLSFLLVILGMKYFSVIYLLLPVYVLILSLQRLYNYVLNRQEKYKEMALANALRAGMASPMQITVSSFFKSMNGLLIGDLFAQLIKLWILIKNTSLSLKSFNRKKVFAAVKVYKNFPLFAMPSELVNHLSIQLPVLLLVYYYGAEAAGLYFLPHKLLSAPLNALGNAISQIYFKDSNKIKRDDKALALLSKKLLKALFLVGFLPFSILFFYGEDLFRFVFGSSWGISGIFASYISPWLFLVFMFSPLSIIFTVFEKLKLSLKLNLLLFAIRLGSILVGVYFFNDLKTTVLFYALGSTFYWFILALYIIKMAKIKFFSIPFFL